MPQEEVELEDGVGQERSRKVDRKQENAQTAQN